MDVVIEDAERVVGEAEVADTEGRLGTTLPAPYRAHLLRHNGGRPTPAHFTLHWPTHADPTITAWSEGSVAWFLSVGDPASDVDLLQAYDGDRGLVPDDTIAIASDPGGNPILLGLTGVNRGRVFFMLRHDGTPDQRGPADRWDNVAHVADTFDAFLAALRPADAV